MTQTLTPQGGVLRQLRMIACAALVGSAFAGATMGWFDPANIETYRAIGASIGALVLTGTGAYRVL